MAVETLNKDSKVVVYNSEVELADKGVRKNHQGVAISELNGFIKVVADVPAEGTVGDIVFATGDNSLNVHNGSAWVSVSLT